MMTDERCTIQELEVGDWSRFAIDHDWLEVTSINTDGTHAAVRWDCCVVELWDHTRLVYVRRKVKTQQPVCTDEAMRFWEKTYSDTMHSTGLSVDISSKRANDATRAWLKAKQDISEGKL